MKIDTPHILKTIVGLALIWCLPILEAAASNAQEKHVIGWIEKVQILPENLSLLAKIDTGADHSSLNAINQEEFRKGKEKWIRFSIPLENDSVIRLERPILRKARIKRKRAASIKRPVVLFNLCVGTLYKKDVPVNLANRSRFKYPMLIGRSFLKDSAIVDSSLTLTQQPSCSTPLPK